MTLGSDTLERRAFENLRCRRIRLAIVHQGDEVAWTGYRHRRRRWGRRHRHRGWSRRREAADHDEAFGLLAWRVTAGGPANDAILPWRLGNDNRALRVFEQLGGEELQAAI